MDGNSTRRLLTGLAAALFGGGVATYMLMHLDREAERLLDRQKYWYPNKINGNAADELKKIRRRIKSFYMICLLLGVICAVFFIVRLVAS